MRRAARIAAVLLAGVLAVTAGVVAVESRPYRGWEGEGVTVAVPEGASSREIARRLAEAGVVRFPWLFSLRARLFGAAGRLHAGEYRFEAPIPPGAVLDRLIEGRVVLHAVTLPEGLSLAETAARLDEEGWGAAEAFRAAFADASLVVDLDPDAEDLEGYLFPDTYAFPRGVSPGEVAATLVRRFRQALDELGWTAGAGSPVRELVTLASLVEKETAVPAERAVVAGVFAGRLRRGWRLECDPTVRYALIRDGLLDDGRALTRGDLEHDSPFNTYRVAGLPPGPICNPGSGALAAALAPAETDALYFVALGDGSGRHAFSRTLKEHLGKVAEYRARRRERESAARGGG